MAYANPSTFVAGAVLTAAQQNVLAANDRFFHGPPTVRVVNSTGYDIPASGLWEEIPFNSESWDSNTMFSSTANTKVFCRTAGKFLVSCHAGFNGSTVGDTRGVGVRNNSTSGNPDFAAGYEGDLAIGAPQRLPFSASDIIALTTGQYLQLVMLHNVGAALGTSTIQERRPTMSMLWVSS